MAPPRKPITKCSAENCIELSKYGGLCGRHYKRQWRHGDVHHCEVTHYQGQICYADGCTELATNNYLCTKHDQRVRRYGRTENIRASSGEGRPQTSAGYVLITVDSKRIYEHVHIAEKALGKKLPEGAIVHHVNNIPWENQNTNLVICLNQAYHMLLHQRMKELGYYQREVHG